MEKTSLIDARLVSEYAFQALDGVRRSGNTSLRQKAYHKSHEYSVQGFLSNGLTPKQIMQKRTGQWKYFERVAEMTVALRRAATNAKLEDGLVC